MAQLRAKHSKRLKIKDATWKDKMDELKEKHREQLKQAKASTKMVDAAKVVMEIESNG